MSTLLLATSVMLVMTSALSLNAFLRLKKASEDYATADAYENACHISLMYTRNAVHLYATVLVFSLILLAWVCYSIYKGDA